MIFLTQRTTIAVFLSGVFATTVILAFIAIYLRLDGYRFLDWLINYEGGFVRRGLTGQFAVELYHLTGIAPTHTVFALQFGAYAAFFIFSYRTLSRIADRTPFVLLVYSPFIFLFQVMDRGAGYRKEILFFALLAFVGYVVATVASDCRKFLTLCIALALYPALVLSHEMLVFYLPYLLFFVVLLRLDPGRIALVGFLVALSVAAAGLTAIFTGSAEHIDAICSSLRDMLPASPAMEECTVRPNAIRWLADDAATGLRAVKIFFPAMLGSLAPALLLIGLAFLPLSNVIRRLDGKAVRFLLLATVTSATMSLVLFVVGVDWGRFLYVHAVALAINSMALTARAQVEASDTGPRMPTIPAWAVAAYLLAWNLNHKGQLVGGGLLMKCINFIIFNPPIAGGVLGE